MQHLPVHVDFLCFHPQNDNLVCCYVGVWANNANNNNRHPAFPDLEMERCHLESDVLLAPNSGFRGKRKEVGKATWIPPPLLYCLLILS